MEWISNIFRYTPLEKELLEENTENPLYERYHETIDIDGTQVYTVVAPPPNAEKIPPLPPIVFIHGLGGSMLAFSYLSQILNRTTKVILIDLPGNGKSPSPPRNTDAFSPNAILSILTKTIERLCPPDSPFIILGHSYGTTHALRISLGSLKQRCCGVICICPPYGVTLPKLEKKLAGYIPVIVFDSMFRARDRLGGLHSNSVNRMLAPEAGERPRRDQLRTNLQAKSATVLQTVSKSIFFNEEKDEGVPECPTLIISAANDSVCPPSKSSEMFARFKRENENVYLKSIGNAGHVVIVEKPEVVGGIISGFLTDHIDKRLSMAWQLSYLASLDNKWSLKNEKKWREVTPVGNQVSNSVFKGMKVPREGDSIHGPTVLEKTHPEIYAIIDISRESPPYDPSMLKRIKYYKFPTVSKIPPSKMEVKGFEDLVDKIRKDAFPANGIIGVHCHYGFNRTGFFICSYLINKENYSVPEALEAFRKSRPPGIKHQHFVNELYVRNSQ